uniref:SNF2 N-terminal domain-containing protein n=1 Tax=Bionectria ochroleuca TaxID=29856 RepID=A0A8H7N9D6_BIOOC
MAPSPAYHYIPVGSVSILRDQSHLGADYWGSDHLRQWVWLSRATDIHHPGAPAYTQPTIPDEAQRQLMGSPELSHYRRLFQHKWANLQFRVHSANHGTLRVYLLPDDVAHRAIDRADVGLQRAKQSILNSIDYSASGWNGNPPDMSAGPVPYQTTDMDTNTQEMTLLQLFNRLNSPSPDPDIVSNAGAQNGMYSLLKSRIDGLKTDLYPHQRRSSALMLQKESQPGQTLDPRLQHVRDQNGEGWYVDLVTGSILKEPRYYDGISGGILAEEMGSGKTLICLALILATKQVSASAPEIYGAGHAPTRPKIASLAEMAASCANRNSVPWKTYFDSYASEYGYEFPECVNALERNPGYYFVPAPETRRCARHRSQYP